jgi:histidine triad (HIT) family protein
MTIHEKIKASEYIIFSDIEILVVLDFDPITKGHVLILPQTPYKDIDEIPEQVLNKVFKVAQLYVKVVKSKYFVKGYSIMHNGGDFNDIDVFHLHLRARC